MNSIAMLDNQRVQASIHVSSVFTSNSNRFFNRSPGLGGQTSDLLSHPVRGKHKTYIWWHVGPDHSRMTCYIPIVDGEIILNPIMILVDIPILNNSLHIFKPMGKSPKMASPQWWADEPSTPCSESLICHHFCRAWACVAQELARAQGYSLQTKSAPRPFLWSMVGIKDGCQTTSMLAITSM